MSRFQHKVLKQIQTYLGGIGSIVKQSEDLYAYRVSSLKLRRGAQPHNFIQAEGTLKGSIFYHISYLILTNTRGLGPPSSLQAAGSLITNKQADYLRACRREVPFLHFTYVNVC